MKQILTVQDIQSLGTILGIWAHPDDETYTMAGIMAAAIQNGQSVICITATRGEAGVQDEARWPAVRLGEIRTEELKNALKELGVTNHHWLDYPDGGCKLVDEDEATERIAELIKKYQPDSIMTFGPDGMTGHEDHKTVSGWATLAAEKASSKAKVYHSIQTKEQYEAMLAADQQFNIYFNTQNPATCARDECAIYFELDDALYERKQAAFYAMPSQTEAMFKVFGGSLRLGVGTEAFREAKL